MTSFPRTRGLRSLAALVAAGLLLTGCGAARPGVAAQIGDDTIGLSEVDGAAQQWCKGWSTQSNGQVVPMRFVRSLVLGSMIERLVGEQIAAEYDVQPGASYAASLAQQRQGLAAFPADTRDALLEQSTAADYRTAILQAAADASLRADGVAVPSATQITERGNDIFKSWPDTHPVVVDPRFGLTVQDGQFTSADSWVSFGTSEVAKAGAADQPDAAYAATLPASQRCG